MSSIHNRVCHFTQLPSHPKIGKVTVMSWLNKLLTRPVEELMGGSPKAALPPLDPLPSVVKPREPSISREARHTPTAPVMGRPRTKTVQDFRCQIQCGSGIN